MMKKIYNISIVGQSNTGKSTLINYLCDKYVTAESKKLQTTRVNLYNQVTINDIDINLIDTPGVSLQNNDLLSTSMKSSYIKTLESIDLLLLMIDIDNKDLKHEDSILNLAKVTNTKVILLINKIDLAGDDLIELENIQSRISDKYTLASYFISLKSKQGLTQLTNGICDNIQVNPPLSKNNIIPENQKTISIQEIIRGVIIEHTHGEIPYDTAVHIENHLIKKKIIEINASIYVNKENQKKIIIGKNGSMIKKIGTESRLKLELIHKKKFFISLNVLVKENWKNNYKLLKEIGYLD
ncbi:MAG: GTPase Era [Pelagibacterales bacterium]|nr:GTPase Era [Pelagibacterales bacterium]MBT7323192.1 GTPase Era [Gammaproteobacteria bacterium]